MTLATDVALRVCTAADAETLALIGGATFLDAFAGFIPGEAILAHCRKNHVAAAYTAYMDLPTTRIWIAEVEPAAAPVGYAMLTAPDFPAGLVEEGDLELRRIYVLSKFLVTKAGHALMALAIAHAREAGAKRLLLGVHPENQRAIAFYKKNGFVQIGERTFHVGPSTFVDPVFALVL